MGAACGALVPVSAHGVLLLSVRCGRQQRFCIRPSR